MSGDLWDGPGLGDDYKPQSRVGGNRRGLYDSRWFIRNGETKHLLFLGNINSEYGRRLIEHSAWNPVGNPRVPVFPCLAVQRKTCWLCAPGEGRPPCPRGAHYLVQVVNRDGYTPKTGPNAGKLVKNPRSLLVLFESQKGSEVDLFRRRDAAQSGLAGCEFKIEKSVARLGDDWTLIRKWTPEELKREGIDTNVVPWETAIPTITSDDQARYFAENPSATWGDRKSDGTSRPAPAAEPTVYPDTDSAPPPNADDIPF